MVLKKCYLAITQQNWLEYREITILHIEAFNTHEKNIYQVIKNYYENCDDTDGVACSIYSPTA
jgi:hypothetical protein